VEQPAGAGPTAEALPKQKRLAKRREFLRVYDNGRKFFARYAVMFFAPNDLPYSRLGITATKKVGKANVRNKLKRWSREIYRRQRAPLALDERAVDVVINVKPNAVDASFDQFQDDLTRLLRRIAPEARG
jgi:ribonuclease P protein component